MHPEGPDPLARVGGSVVAVPPHPGGVESNGPFRNDRRLARLPDESTRLRRSIDLRRRDRHPINDQDDVVADRKVDFDLDLAQHCVAVRGGVALERLGDLREAPARCEDNGADGDRGEGEAEKRVDEAVAIHDVGSYGVRAILEFGYRVAMRFNPVLEQLGSYPIALVHERARAMREAGKTVIDFSIGDPREPTPEFIPHALKDSVPVVSQYPTTAGLTELRGAIADYLGRRFGVSIDPDTQIIPTSGSKEAVFNSPLAFVDRARRDVVICGTPGYPIYERGALFAGAETHPVVLHGDFVMRAGDIPEETWGRAALAWICTPHNPTGAVTGDEDLAVLVETARRHGTLLLSDECYMDVYEPEAHPDGPSSVLQFAGPGARGVLSFFSLSKRSGMTGYRSGAIVGDADAIAALKKLRTATGTASPEFVQAAAVAAWSDDGHAAERREIFAAKRRVLREAFDKLALEVVASTAGLYVWVRVDDDLAATERLLERGVVVSPGRFFGSGGEGHLRLALVPTVAECEKAVEVLVQCLS